MSETLSPSEIQSLFAGLDLAGGGAEPRGRSAAAPDPIRAADQFTLPMSVDGVELAALKAWQAALGKSWSGAWTESLAGRFTLRTAELAVVRLRDFVASHAGWQGFQVTAREHGCPVWIAADDALVAAHLDCVLGGTEPVTQPPRRLRGPLEQQLTGRLITGLCESLFQSAAAAWQVKAVNSTVDWIAGIPVYLSCEIVQFDFEVRCSGISGHLSLGIPRAACHQLCGTAATGTLAAVPSTQAVQLRATLAPISLSPSELQELQVGDVLLIPQHEQGACQVTWDGQQRFTASIGAHQGHKAVRLTAEVE